MADAIADDGCSMCGSKTATDNFEMASDPAGM